MYGVTQLNIIIVQQGQVRPRSQTWTASYSSPFPASFFSFVPPCTLYGLSRRFLGCIRRGCRLPYRDPREGEIRYARQKWKGETYDLTDHLDVLATNDEDAAGDVAEDVLAVDSLDGILRHEIAWARSVYE